MHGPTNIRDLGSLHAYVGDFEWDFKRVFKSRRLITKENRQLYLDKPK